MQMSPNEIDTVEEAGELDGSPVKLIRTRGGFFLLIGKPKGKMREEALTAGSHPAIVKFNLEKQYPNYRPSMMKSEHFSDNAIVEKHSHFLPADLRKSGHDIYSVQDGSSIDFHITKQNLKIATVLGTLQEQTIVIKDLNMGKEFARAMAGATTEKAMSCGATKLRIGDK